MTGLILDIAIIVVALLLLIFGLWRGLYKIVFGLVSALLAIVLTLALVSPVTTLLVDNTTLDERLAIAIDEPLSASFPNGDVVVQLYDFDGDGEATDVAFLVDGGDPIPMADALAGSPYAMLSGVMEGLVSTELVNNQPAEGEEAVDVTFISVLSKVIIGYVIMAIVFVVLLIVLSILVALIMKLIKKFVTHTYLGHFLDKLLGGVVGVVIAAVVILGALAIIRVLGTYEWIIPVNNLIESSTVTKLLYENNILYTFLVDSFDLKGMLDSLLAGANSTPVDPGAGEEGVEQFIGIVKRIAA